MEADPFSGGPSLLLLHIKTEGVSKSSRFQQNEAPSAPLRFGADV